MQGRVLAVDSTLGAGSVALALGGEPRASLTAEGDGKGKLPRLVAELLAAHGLAPRDLDAIVVGTGPGRFTGVRGAVAVAKGLAWALSLPLASVGSLEALACVAAQEPQGERWIVLGDGPRNVYAAPGGKAAEPESFELAAFVKARSSEGAPSTIIVGAALEALREALHQARAQVILLEQRLDARAHLTAALAGARLVSVHDVEPSYVREASITLPKVAPPLLAFR